MHIGRGLQGEYILLFSPELAAYFAGEHGDGGELQSNFRLTFDELKHVAGAHKPMPERKRDHRGHASAFVNLNLAVAVFPLSP